MYTEAGQSSGQSERGRAENHGGQENLLANVTQHLSFSGDFGILSLYSRSCVHYNVTRELLRVCAGTMSDHK